MATGYTRQSAAAIVDDAVIEAAHHNDEYNAIEAAFHATTGHNHDGTAQGGAKIPPLGLAGIASGQTGFYVITSNTVGTYRSISGTTNRISVTNGDGVSGNPTIDLATVSGLTPGSYTNTSLTVDAYGRITAASSGAVAATMGKAIAMAIVFG